MRCGLKTTPSALIGAGNPIYTFVLHKELKNIVTDHKDSSLKGKPGKAAPSVVKGKKFGVKSIKSLKSKREFGRHLVNTMKSINLRKAQVLVQKAEFEKKYFSVDQKGIPDSPFTDKLKLIDMELAELRSAAKDMFGNQHFEIDLFDIPTVTVTSGGAFAAQAVRPEIQFGSLSAEFSACAVLFDEYKLGAFTSNIYSQAFGGVPNSGAGNQNAFGVICWDPDSSAPTNSRTVALEHEHHIVIPTAATIFATNSPIVSLPGKPYHWHVRMPSGILVSTALPSTIGMEGGWQPTVPASSFLPYGYILPAFQGLANTNGTSAVDLQMTYHVQFRMRV